MGQEVTEGSGRSNRERVRRWRIAQIAAALPLGLVSLLRLRRVEAADRPFVFGMLAAMFVAAALVLAWARRRERPVRGMRSRAEFSDHLSNSSPFWRSNFIWAEYAMARATVDGAAEHRAPSQYGPEATMYAQQMQDGTRQGLHIQLAVFGAVTGAMPVVFAVAFRPDWLTGLLVGSCVGLLMVPFFAFGVWRRSRRAKRPIAQLGRRIEAASLLHGDARWSELLRIAEQHAMLESTAA